MSRFSIALRFLFLLAVLAVLSVPVRATEPAEASTSEGSTAEDAAAFLAEAEAAYLAAAIEAERASWVNRTYITDDTDAIASAAEQAMIAVTVKLATEAGRFDGLDLDPDVRRRLDRLKLMLSKPSPDDPAKRAELSRASTDLGSAYGKGEYCNEADGCRDLGELSEVLATSRDPEALLDAWAGWRTVSVPMREDYAAFAALGNEGARALGFSDLGALWRSKYDMAPDAFAAETDRLWSQVEPLYEQLHCYVRARLSDHYGPRSCPPTAPFRHMSSATCGPRAGPTSSTSSPRKAAVAVSTSPLCWRRPTTTP